MLYKIEKKHIIVSWRMKLAKIKAQKILYEKANELRSENLFKEAAANYLNAILIDRKSAESYFGLGLCYKHLKQYDKAIKYFETAAKLDENYFEAFFELGICHQLNETYCCAIKSFIRAIQINPDSPDAILQLGISHEMCEEEEMALMIYQKLIENSPDYVKSYEHKASLLMKQKRFTEAAKVLNELLKNNQEHYDALAGIGVCFEKLGRKTDAIRYYRKFSTYRPLSPQTSFIQNRLENLRKKNNGKNHLACVK